MFHVKHRVSWIGGEHPPVCSIFGIDDAIIGGALALAGSGIGAAASISNTASANRAAAGRSFEANATGVEMMRQGFNFDADEAAKAREWEEMMAKITRVYNRDEASMARDWSANQATTQYDRALEMLRRDQDFAREQTASSQQFGAAEAEKQRLFQERMSGTAYQRATADMRAAGINPLLMTPGGASTPSGGIPSAQTMSASGSSPGLPSAAVGSTGTPGGFSAKGSGFHPGAMAQTFQADIGNVVSNAFRGGAFITDLQAKKSQIANTDADTMNKHVSNEAIRAQVQQIVSDTVLKQKQGNFTDADTERVKALTQSLMEDPALKRANAQAAIAAAGASEQSAHTGKAHQHLLEGQTEVLNRTAGGKAATELTGAASAVRGIFKDIGDYFRK